MKLEENRIFILKFELKVGDFSGGYSQTDCDFNFDINVNVTVHRNMISSFNFSFSLQVKDLHAFRIMKLESTSKITVQFETIPQGLTVCYYHVTYAFRVNPHCMVA